jgi:hypothetical protein
MTLPNTEIGFDGSAQIGASQVSELMKWSYTPTANTKTYTSAQSQGCERNRRGALGCSGTVEGKWDSAVPIDSVLHEGDYVTLTLTMASGRHFIIPATVSEGPSLVMDTGDIKGFTFSYKNDGPWTRADGTSSAQT